MKNPREVSTRHRAEMVCPRCFTQGLEAHPGYIEDYTGDLAILRATRCPNQECDFHGGRGVPEDAIREQYDQPGMLDKLSGNLDASTLLMGALIICGFGFLLVNFLGVGIPGLGGGTTDVTVQGEVRAADGSPVPNASVYVVGGETRATTGPDGTYQLANLTDGSHVVSIEPQEDYLAASTVVVNISDSGDVTLAEASNETTYDGGTLNVRISETTRLQLNERVANGTFLLNYSNPANAQKGGGVAVTLAPPPGDTVADEVSVQDGQPQKFDIPGVVTSQTVRVTTGVATADQTKTYTWSGGEPASVSLVGNIPPDALIVDVADDANVRERRVEHSVSDGASFTETAQADMDGDLSVTIWGGSATAPTTTSGTYSGSNPTIDIAEDSAPAQVSVSVTGKQRTTEKTTTGTVSDTYASFNIDGNLDARNAVIAFTGGTPESSQIAETTVSADASNGDDTTENQLFKADSSGTYRIEWDYTIDRNEDLVRAGYEVNGQRTEVAEGTDSVDLDLVDGDRVSVWVEAEQETLSSDKSYSRDGHDIYVIDQEVSSTNVAVGETVRISATLENKGDPYTIDVLQYTDGNVSQKDNEYFDAGQTKTVYFDVTFSEEGTHTLSVNEGDQISIQVGDTSARSGAGSLDGTATKLGDGGTVNVDTNGDGSPDCTTDANGGSCELGTLSPGSQQIVVTEEGVTDTGFEVRYDARYGPKDVSVDIDSDGVTDIEHDGPLADGETATGSAQVGAGTNAILFNVGNGGEVDYRIEYTEPGQVTKPKLYVDGELVIDETENFKGEREYTVEGLAEGSHTFEVESANASNEFNVRLEWTESGQDLYPTMTLDGEEVCQPLQFASGSCRVPDPGTTGETLSLAFAGGANTFDYDVTYTARATPSEVSLSGNGETQRFLERALDTRNDDGSWEKQTSVSMLQSGTNRLSISTPTVDGLTPGATATVEYTYTAKKPKNPKVVVVSADGETNEKVVDDASLNSEGVLQEEVSFELPAEWFARGENEVRVVASNGGVVDATVVATAEREGALRLADPEDDE